jgi:beta-xylosidase
MADRMWVIIPTKRATGHYGLKHKGISIALLIVLLITALGQTTSAQQKKEHTGEWGDQQNGTFKNPVLNADYSDPDVIKVGNIFYMVCSDFHYIGMPILQSKDLVNWTIINQIYKRFDYDQGYDRMTKYGEGSWAPSIRYHDHKFYVYFCTPNEGLYMSTATDPDGQWSALTEVERVKGWEDPCPFWDDNGDAYLGHSKLGAGPIIVHRLSKDGKRLLDSGTVVYEGPIAEGTKFYKRNGYYYLIIPEGGVGSGYETALRSRSIYGPYERKIVLEQGSTKINGPHQGGMVELDSGESWFVHFQDNGALGRIAHLEPVKWTKDWPVIGVDYDHNGVGEPVDIYKKPNVGKEYPVAVPQTSDEFNRASLGLQWQWNHNPVDKNWSLIENKGYLTLKALKAPDNKHALNTLTQKMTGSKGEITTSLLLKGIKNGQRSGLCLIGENIYEIGITKLNDTVSFFANNNGKETRGDAIKADRVYLRIEMDLNSNTTMLFSLDGKEFKRLGDYCQISRSNYWKGARPALFSYNKIAKDGIALFDWFHSHNNGPLGDQ